MMVLNSMKLGDMKMETIKEFKMLMEKHQKIVDRDLKIGWTIFGAIMTVVFILFVVR